MVNERIDAWNWQVWRVVKDKREWVGFFESDKDARRWVKTQKGDFVINNVPPDGRNSIGKIAQNTPATSVHDTVTAVPTKARRKAAKPQPMTAAEKRLKAEAQAIFDKHKADEAAELAKEAK